jgi:hypothetical protein
VPFINRLQKIYIDFTPKKKKATRNKGTSRKKCNESFWSKGLLREELCTKLTAKLRHGRRNEWRRHTGLLEWELNVSGLGSREVELLRGLHDVLLCGLRDVLHLRLKRLKLLCEHGGLCHLRLLLWVQLQLELAGRRLL